MGKTQITDSKIILFSFFFKKGSISHINLDFKITKRNIPEGGAGRGQTLSPSEHREAHSTESLSRSPFLRTSQCYFPVPQLCHQRLWFVRKPIFITLGQQFLAHGNRKHL